jgi:catechol 2,3-dioxygenase-like lactoylglutathione lyase family enzyme
VKIQFVAGFGPIVRDLEASRRFYQDALGLPIKALTEDGTYLGIEDGHLEGVKAFALWRLEDAAESCFGKNQWPSHVSVPQAWLELDVESVDAVAAAARELEAKGYALLVPAREEPWKQVVSRLLSPEGILVGVVYTPWMHREEAAAV